MGTIPFAMPRPPRDEDVVKPNPRLPRSLYDRLQRIATRERRSLNEQIVKALEEHAEREEQKKR